MNQEIKAKLVEALRSGRYEQGQGVLRSPDNKFCCLGVLCDIVDPEGWGEVVASTTCETGHLHRLGYVEMITGEMKRKAGFGDGTARELATLNDMGETFDVIADHIMENL